MPHQTQDVPNQPKTPQRAVRIPDWLWNKARDAARARGQDRSEVIRDALEGYVLVPDDVCGEAKALAGERGWSTGRMMAEAVTEWVERHKGKK